MRQQQEEQKVNFGYYGPWAVWRDRSLEDIQAQLALGRPLGPSFPLHRLSGT